MKIPASALVLYALIGVILVGGAYYLGTQNASSSSNPLASLAPELAALA